MQDDRDILFGTAGIGRFAAPREQRVESRPESNLLRMGLIAGGVAILVLVVLTAWSWVGHHRTGVPVVEADTRAIKERPVDQGGLKVEGANEAILSGKTESKPTVTASPEAPALGALRTAPPPLKVIDTPPASTGSTQDGVRVSTLGETPLTPQLNIAVRDRPSAPVANPDQKLANAATSAPASKGAPASPTATAPSAATAMSVTPTPTAPAPVASAPAHSAAKVAAATPVATPASTPAATHAAGPVVQLGALATEAGAKQEWQRLSKHYADLLGSHSPVIASVTRDGKTMWRLRVAGFSDIAAAHALCNKLKAAGGQCMVLQKG